MPRRIPESLIEQGRAAYRQGRLNYARQIFRNALKACAAGCDAELKAEIHVAIGKVERDLNQNEPALNHYCSAAEIFRQVNNQMSLAHAARHIADILREMGRQRQAEPFAVDAIGIYRTQNPLPRLHLANGLRVAALLNEDMQNHDTSLRCWAEARDLYRQEGIDAGVAESAMHIASLRGR
jgi:tetratricopeptide (TPR) repeat protein